MDSGCCRWGALPKRCGATGRPRQQLTWEPSRLGLKRKLVGCPSCASHGTGHLPYLNDFSPVVVLREKRTNVIFKN